MPRLQNTALNFRKENTKDFLVMGNLLSASYCESCLKRLCNTPQLIYENDLLFCNKECSRIYRMDRTLKLKGVRANND